MTIFYACLVCFLSALAGCGGGSNVTSQPPPPPPQINSVGVSPSSIALLTGSTQLFTAKVTGIGNFDPSVTWSVNGVVGGNSANGTITTGGQYTAPTTVSNSSSITITAASVAAPATFGIALAAIYPRASIVSIVPPAASAGEQITISGQNLVGASSVMFTGVNGTSISMPAQPSSPTQLVVKVPFGAATGPLSVSVNPFQGANEITNPISLTRLPNLQIRAPYKDLSSGETLQLDWRLLGASTPNLVTWAADSGTVSSQGIFQAPPVTSESYSHVTGCVNGTNSCDTVLFRILPFRITPATPIVSVGGTLQLSAVQGGSLLSPQWSILAGGGSITTGGLFTAPTTVAQAGPVIVSAIVGSTTEQTSIAVSGAYAGQVNRVYDYANFNTFTPPEATSVESVAVNGNRAYTITSGNPYHLTPGYKALDVYDVSNPDQPVWIDAGEAVINSSTPFAELFAYGNTLFSLDLENLVTYNLSSQIPTLTAITPITSPVERSFNNGTLYVLTNQPYGVATMPVDTYTMNAGTAVRSHYDLPQPASGVALSSITGNGNILYGSFSTNVNNNPEFTILTYDISKSPPVLLSTITSASNDGFGTDVDQLYLSGKLLFANSQVYDVSNISPVLVATVPVTLGRVWGVEGNSVLTSGGVVYWGGSANYVVVDVSSPSSPTVKANVVDLMNWDVFNPVNATWAGNSRFYTADGTGGIAVYNTSASGGPAAVVVDPMFIYIYDQQIQQQTLYASALYGSGAGGLGCFDLSSGTPNLAGTLMYSNDPSFALQASGTTVFLGMADSLKVVDASSPQSPSEVASVSVPVNALALSGNRLFAGTGDGRLLVFDVSTPTSPTQIASVSMPAPMTMRLSGSLLLVAAGQSGLLVFDVSNPNAPVMLSQFSPGVSAPVWDVVPLQGSAAMLAADISGIVTVDLSNPSRPQQLYQQPLPYLNAFPAPSTASGIIPAFSLASQNGLTYVGTTAGVMFTFDATVPANPRLMGLNVEGEDDLSIVSAITPGGNNLYLAVQGTTIQLDNTVPQNLVELYYPPSALSYAIQITGEDLRGSALFRFGKHSDGSLGIASSRDRFPVVRKEKQQYFRKPGVS